MSKQTISKGLVRGRWVATLLLAMGGLVVVADYASAQEAPAPPSSYHGRLERARRRAEEEARAREAGGVIPAPNGNTGINGTGLPFPNGNTGINGRGRPAPMPLPGTGVPQRPPRRTNGTFNLPETRDVQVPTTGNGVFGGNGGGNKAGKKGGNKAGNRGGNQDGQGAKSFFRGPKFGR